MIAGETASDFDALLQRIHPAESRVRKLGEETPATYVLFDVLVDGRERALRKAASRTPRTSRNLRRAKFSGTSRTIRLSPATGDVALAKQWLDGSLARLDGIIAKRDVPYAFGSRDAVVKIKRSYTADCVIGGFRTSKDGTVASLLLGLYDDDGLLHHVGFVGSMGAAERKRAGDLLDRSSNRRDLPATRRAVRAAGGASGDAPWFPVRPEVVVEVAFDHVTARRFRHAARLLRWRPIKRRASARWSNCWRRVSPFDSASLRDAPLRMTRGHLRNS